MANAEMEVGGEDESGLDEALLPGLGGDEDEDAVASQLVSAGERSSNRGGKRYSPCGILYSKKFWAMIFVLFTMLGLSASVFAVYSCDIVAVEWNANLKLSVTGIGAFGYQREDSKTSKSVCVGYGAKEKMPSNFSDFFPASKLLQAYAVAAPSLYFAAVLAMASLALIRLIDPEEFSATRESPSRILLTLLSVSAGLRLISGVFQLLAIFGLFNWDEFESAPSPICNPDYSVCKWGGGGHWAIFATFNCWFTGSILSFFVYWFGFKGR